MNSEALNNQNYEDEQNFGSNQSGKFKANESQKGMMVEAISEDNVSQ